MNFQPPTIDQLEGPGLSLQDVALLSEAVVRTLQFFTAIDKLYDDLDQWDEAAAEFKIYLDRWGASRAARQLIEFDFKKMRLLFRERVEERLRFKKLISVNN
ncbi:MAG: hypothetical protein ABII09_10980 [Planctomycetota bacterium]